MSTTQATQAIRTRVLNTTLDAVGNYAFKKCLVRLNVQADSAVSTMCTDGHYIKVNPAFADTLTDREFVSVLEHEVLHVVLEHHRLAAVLDPLGTQHERLAIAADMEVNSHIKGLPAGCIYAASFGLPDGKGTVWYFNNLPDDLTVGMSQDFDIGAVVSNADEADEGCGEAIPTSLAEETRLEYGLTGRSSVMELEHDKFNHAIVQKLLRWVKQTQRPDYTRQKQSRQDSRFFGRVAIKPQRERYAVYVDISASMEAYYKYFDSFIRQLSTKDLWYAGMFNTALVEYDPQRFGGGTDISPVFEHASEHGYTPIIFTDGEYADRPYPTSTVFVLTEQHHEREYGTRKLVLKASVLGMVD